MQHQQSTWMTDTESEFEGGLRRKPPTTVQIGKYKMSKILGHGSFGKVKLAKHIITGVSVAIKVVNRSHFRAPDLLQKLQREIRILMTLQHPHITRLYEVIETPANVFLVMELCSGGELFDQLIARGKLPEDEARRLFQQMISALRYCHQHGVVHRDLKLENLLLTADGSIKVADFGLANLMQDGEFLRTACGSPNYAAPEIISSKLYAGSEADCWSAGVILYAMLVGSLPFDDDTLPKLYEKIKSGNYVMPSFLSDTSRDLISKMLCVDPIKRITLNEIQKHSWYAKNLPLYLASRPSRKKLVHVPADDPIEDEILDKLLNLNDLQPLQKHRESVINWLQNGAAVRSRMLGSKDQQEPEEQQAKHDKLCFRLRVAYDLLSDSMSNKQGESTGMKTITRLSSISHNQPYGGSHDENGVAEQNYLSSSSQSWFLGIQTKRDILSTVRKIIRVLHISLKCQWQMVDPYRIHCRWRPLCLNLVDHPAAHEWIYASLQIYKIDRQAYMLDFQRIGSHSATLAWMNFCMTFINSLQALTSKVDRSGGVAKQSGSKQGHTVGDELS